MSSPRPWKYNQKHGSMIKDKTGRVVAIIMSRGDLAIEDRDLIIRSVNESEKGSR